MTEQLVVAAILRLYRLRHVCRLIGEGDQVGSSWWEWRASAEAERELRLT
jgi:hypothetical protein